MDLSIPRFYFDATGKITPIGEGEDYKNKVFEFDTKKKVGLQRWLLVDHLSGAFFVWYSLYHKTVEVAEFLFKAWEQKGDGSEFPFHGLPEALIIDNDKSLRSRAMLQMFEYLGVLIPDVTPYKARIKGTVENFHYQWERWFEPRFLHEKIMDIDEINRLAFQKAIEYQSTRIHGRHGKTRFDKWMERVENLRELPPYPLYQSLLHGVPESRVVDGEGAFSFRSQKYVLKGISHTKVDVSIHPYKYQKDMTVTVQYPSRELNLNNFLSTQIQTFSVNPVYKDQDGFYQGNPVWLVDHVPEQITEREINKEKAKKIGEALDITKIKPFKKRPEANKKFIPKTGTPVIPVSDIVIGPEVYNTTQARMKYKDILGRRLNATEKKALDAFLEEKDQVTSADLKTFIETSSQTNEGLGA
ncbi:MAG: transposase family protein [bacterium]|nr:transposase family protein [bacterium]